MRKANKTELHVGKRSIIISALLLLLVLLVSVASFAWFRHKIAMNGVDISTGRVAYRFIGYQIYETENSSTVKKNFAYSTDANDYENNMFDFETQNGYYPIGVDKNGNTEIAQSPVSGVSSIVSDGESPNVTMEKDGVFYYIVERLPDSVDLDISLTFNPQIENLRVAGGFWYNVDTKSSGVLSNPETVFQNSAIDEKSPLSSIQNTTQTTSLSGGSKYWYIRLTFGLQPRAESVDYTNQNMELAPTLCVAQKGGLEDYSKQQERQVTTLEDFERELANYTPNETIVVKGSIEYIGDLIINRPLNLRIEGATLTVRGDLRYNYTGAGSFTIDTSLNGTLRVLTHEASGSGGSVHIEIPASSLTIIGKGTNDIEVQGNFTASVAYHIDGIDGDGKEMNYGLVIDRARITHTNTDLKTLRFRDMSSLLIKKYTEVGEVRVSSNFHLYRMKINNEGTIKKIDLAQMSEQNAANSFSGVSISIENQNTIRESILLPQWSTPFTETNTDGNTRISKHLSANDTTVDESRSAFKNEHIELITKELLVEKDVNDPKKITLYYMKTREQQENNEPTSAMLILTKYSTAEDETQIPSLDQITHLTIVCNSEQMSAEDYRFIRENMPALTSLDLTDAVSVNGTVPANAFLGLNNLKTVKMPYADTNWSANLFSQTKVDEVSIPLPVQSVSASTFAKTNIDGTTEYVRYIYVESDVVYALGNNSLIFVPNAETVDKYSQNVGNVFVKAERFDTDYGTFFLKLTGTGCEFIVWDNLKPNWMDAFSSSVLREINVDGVNRVYYDVDMSTIRVGYALSYDIEAIGRYAFYNANASSGTRLNGTPYRYVLHFGEKMTTFSKQAFNNCNDIYAIYAENVTHCGTNAIANCSQLYRLTLPSLTSIGEANSTASIIKNCEKLNWMETGIFNRNHTMSNCGIFAENCRSLYLLIINEPADGSSYTSISVPTTIASGHSNLKLVITKDYYSYYSGNKFSMQGATRDELKLSPAPVEHDVFTLPKFVSYGNTLLATTYSTCEADLVFEGFPTGVSVIGTNAFRYLSITSATNPNSVLRIPDGVTQIDEYAFHGSNKVYNTLDLNDVINVKHYVFQTNKMISVEGPNVERIGAYSFADSKMYTLNLPSWRYVYNKPSGASYPCYFYNCTNLKYANLGPLDDLGNEDTWAFWKCTSLVLVTIDGEHRGPGSKAILELGWWSDTAKFLAIVSGTNSVIPSSTSAGGSSYEILVDSLNDLAYGNFTTHEITMDGLTGSYSIPTLILTKNGDESYSYRKHNETSIAGDFVIPSTLHSTGRTVEFLGEEVEIYDFDTGNLSTQVGYINEITTAAFSGVSFANCKKVTMSSQVRTIGASTFANCAAEEFDLANVETIGVGAFSGAKMKKLTAKHVKTLSEESFYNCINLKELELPSFEVANGTRNGPLCGSGVTKVTLGPNTRNLGKFMFYKCTSLNTITIESAIVPIAQDPFYLEGGQTKVNDITMIVREQAGFLDADPTNWFGVPRDNFEYYDNSTEVNKILYYWNIIKGTNEAKITGVKLLEGWQEVNGDIFVIPSTLQLPPSDALPRAERLLEDLAAYFENENITYNGYLALFDLTVESNDEDILEALIEDANNGWEKLKTYLLSVLLSTPIEPDESYPDSAEPFFMTQEEAIAAITEAMDDMEEDLKKAKEALLSVGEYKVVYVNGDVIKSVSNVYSFVELKLPYGLRTLDFGYDDIPSKLVRFSITDAPEGEQVYFTVDERGALYNRDGSILLLYPVGNKEKSYTVADTVKVISSSAFRNNNFLETVIFEGDVSISSNAFDSCLNLREIIFEDDGNGLPSMFIGYDIFYNSGNLTHIYVPVGELERYKEMIVYDRVIIDSYMAEQPQIAE